MSDLSRPLTYSYPHLYVYPIRKTVIVPGQIGEPSKVTVVRPGGWSWAVFGPDATPVADGEQASWRAALAMGGAVMDVARAGAASRAAA